MVQSIDTAKFSASELDQLAADLNRDGICILHGVCDRAFVEEWASAFDALFQERQQRPGGVAPRGKARGYVTLPWVAPFANPDVFANPTILGLLDRVFYQEYKLVQLAADIPMQGSEYQEIHRDFRPLFTDQIVTPLYALAVNFPLVEVTADGVADQVMGHYSDAGNETGPRVLRSHPGYVLGPGHNSIVTGPNGQDYVIYHAWDTQMTARRMCIDRLF